VPNLCLVAVEARSERRPVEFLDEEERRTLTASPDSTTWIGRRDRTLLLLALQTGLRSSELTALQRSDVVLGSGAHIRCFGKGRKTRCTPLRRDVVAVTAAWLDEQPPDAAAYVFPSSRGGRLSPDALQRLVAKHAAAAATRCPSLAAKNVTPHVLRHYPGRSVIQTGGC
jgi:integrase/recombinase XerD